MTARTMNLAAVSWTHERASPIFAVPPRLRSGGADLGLVALVGLVAVTALVSMTAALYNPAASDLIATISGF